MTLMSDSYKVKVNDRFPSILTRNQFLNLMQCQLKQTICTLQHKKSYKATIVSADFNQKKYTVKVNNNTYTTAIANDLGPAHQRLRF
jgi:hypothetical protein